MKTFRIIECIVDATIRIGLFAYTVCAIYLACKGALVWWWFAWGGAVTLVLYHKRIVEYCDTLGGEDE